MDTAIQVDKEVKHKLRELKRKLSLEKGKNVSYNEVILFLLENQAPPTKDTKNSLSFRKSAGILSKGAYDEYIKEKRADLAREEKKYPLRK